jgi:MFS family permease
MLAVDTLIIALFAPYAGATADRLDRRKVMVVAGLVSTCFASLLLLVRSDSTAWVALVGIGGIAAAKAFYQPAAGAALPNLVDPPDLPRANVLNGATWGSMLVVGAGLGAIANALVGPYWCFVIDAASFAVAAGLTARTTRPFGEAREAAPARRKAREDLAETIAYARSDHRVLALLCCKWGAGLGIGAVALYPLMVERHLGGADYGTGLLMVGRGAGALVGPLVVRRAVEDISRLPRVLTASLALVGVGYTAFALAPSIEIAFVAVFLAHCGGGANWVLSTLGLQRLVPDRLRGRVFSADFMLVTLAVSVSQLAASLTAEALPLRAVALGLAATVGAYTVVWSALTARTWHGT